MKHSADERRASDKKKERGTHRCDRMDIRRGHGRHAPPTPGPTAHEQAAKETAHIGYGGGHPAETKRRKKEKNGCR